LKSIRMRLLVTLATAFVLGWIVLALFIHTETRHEITELYDAELARFADIITHLPINEERLETMHQPGIGSAELGHRYGNFISVQQWIGTRLVYRSQNVPDYRITSENGYSDVIIDNEPWRFFQLETGDNGLLIVGEKYRVRNELINNIAANTIAPMIWTLPLLFFALHVAISKGLKPLKTLSKEVSKRDHRSLLPVAINQAPEEVWPLTQALNRLLTRLQEAFEKESHFTADASHELRTPLAGIRTQTQLALRHCKEQETIAALNKALQGLDRCDRLVEQMLTLHRLNPEQAGEHFQLVDLVELANSACEDLAPQAREKSIRITTRFDETSEPLLTSGYSPGLYIMLRNILENAIHYTPECGEIQVAVTTSGKNEIRLEITDSGPGIPDEIRQRVFNRFFRQQGTAVPGAGLGLSIVKQIADLHKIRLIIKNLKTGTGLRFSALFKKAIDSS